ncbi:MAG: peptidylprolyl isomerase [Parcubacteria group bacterium]|jgi:parvulin-like peptidyl-prolyl isomerase
MNDRHKKILTVISAIVFIVIIFIGVVTYIFRMDTPAVVYVRQALHFPAVIVDGVWISMKEMEENTLSIKQFYENQDFSSYGIRIDFTTDDGKKRLKIEQKKMLNKLIEDKAIAAIAKEWNISISDEAVQTAMDRPMDEAGTRESVKEQLKNLYGWTLDDFGRKVVYEQLLRRKVSEEFDKKNVATDAMHEQINKAKKELDDGRTFADVATKYSNGSTASEGGVMGWFAASDLQKEIGDKIFTMEKGTYTDVIETSLGLHIVQINDVAEKDGIKLMHVSQIIVKKQTFAQFLEEKIKKMNVKIFLPQYVWDKENGLIIFKDDDMKAFEEKMRTEEAEAQNASSK